MRTVLALTVVVLLVSPVIALENGKESIEVKITVKGMSCPDGCAPVVSKGLRKLEIVLDVELADFKSGTFKLKVDAGKKLSPLALQDAIGTAYVLGRIKTTIVGTVSNGKRGLTITTAMGVKYALKEGQPIKKAFACAECPPAPNAKKGTVCGAKTTAGKTLAQIGAWLEEGKTTLCVTGDLDEFCPGKVVLGIRAAKLVGAETSKN